MSRNLKISKQMITETAEKLGWTVDFGDQRNSSGKLDKYVEFFKMSPAGEDFGFCVFYDTLADIADEVESFYSGFDIEEHVSMWLDGKRHGTSGVPDIVTLVNDAKEIESMILELSEALQATIWG